MADRDSTTQHDSENGRPGRLMLVALYLPLIVPALIPAYYATKQDDPMVSTAMGATSFAILVFNAVVLYLAYRWLTRTAS